MKTIGLSESLAILKDDLESLGYRVIIGDSISSPIDVFIYSGDFHQSSLYSTAQTLNTFSSVDAEMSYHNQLGILLIEGGNKSIDDIVYIIENKVYSPIF